jgi:hypothetical protein
MLGYRLEERRIACFEGIGTVLVLDVIHIRAGLYIRVFPVLSSG